MSFAKKYVATTAMLLPLAACNRSDTAANPQRNDNVGALPSFMQEVEKSIAFDRVLSEASKTLGNQRHNQPKATAQEKQQAADTIERMLSIVSEYMQLENQAKKLEPLRLSDNDTDRELVYASEKNKEKKLREFLEIFVEQSPAVQLEIYDQARVGAKVEPDNAKREALETLFVELLDHLGVESKLLYEIRKLAEPVGKLNAALREMDPKNPADAAHDQQVQSLYNKAMEIVKILSAVSESRANQLDLEVDARTKFSDVAAEFSCASEDNIKREILAKLCDDRYAAFGDQVKYNAILRVEKSLENTLNRNLVPEYELGR